MIYDYLYILYSIFKLCTQPATYTDQKERGTEKYSVPVHSFLGFLNVNFCMLHNTTF